MARDNSEFVIFHNNVNSLCDIESDKFGKVKSIFQNCSSMPDLLAFSDTRVDNNSLIPLLNGYHDFEFTPTPTGAGGVGFYLKEEFDYILRPDLNLNLTLCEDIWFRVKNVDNPKLNGNGFIIGVIYRHGHHVKDFYEELSEQLLLLIYI